MKLKDIAHNFVMSATRRWNECHRNRRRFALKNKSWLNAKLAISSIESIAKPLLDIKRRGRPPKTFAESAPKIKNRKVQRLIHSHSTAELSLAVKLRSHKSGRRSDAAIIGEIIETSPTRESRIKKTHSAGQRTVSQSFSAEEAFALMIDLKLSKNQYISLRKRIRDK